jgi:hypothetical protein
MQIIVAESSVVRTTNCQISYYLSDRQSGLVCLKFNIFLTAKHRIFQTLPVPLLVLLTDGLMDARMGGYGRRKCLQSARR